MVESLERTLKHHSAGHSRNGRSSANHMSDADDRHQHKTSTTKFDSTSSNSRNGKSNANHKSRTYHRQDSHHKTAGSVTSETLRVESLPVDEDEDMSLACVNRPHPFYEEWTGVECDHPSYFCFSESINRHCCKCRPECCGQCNATATRNDPYLACPVIAPPTSRSGITDGMMDSPSKIIISLSCFFAVLFAIWAFIYVSWDKHRMEMDFDEKNKNLRLYREDEFGEEEEHFQNRPTKNSHRGSATDSMRGLDSKSLIDAGYEIEKDADIEAPIEDEVKKDTEIIAIEAPENAGKEDIEIEAPVDDPIDNAVKKDADTEASVENAVKKDTDVDASIENPVENDTDIDAPIQNAAKEGAEIDASVEDGASPK